MTHPNRSAFKKKASYTGAITIWVLLTLGFFISVFLLVAVPIFKNYRAKAISSEARTNVRKIYDGELSFFDDQQFNEPNVPKRFISAGPEPTSPKKNKQVGNWNQESWQALKFGSDSPVYYSYSAIASGQGLTASFTARAVGDLDGDGNTSLFERVGSVNPYTGEVEGGAGLYSQNDLDGAGSLNPIARGVLKATRGFRNPYLRRSRTLPQPAIDPIQRYRQDFNTETYDHLGENPFIKVEHDPLSTFSIDVDTASYSNLRRFLSQGQLPPKDAIRVEEMINYFNYDYTPPKSERPFAVHMEVAKAPWKSEHRLVRIGIKGKVIPASKRPPSNLVFLLDVSGSMASWNKLPLVQRSMKMLVNNLTRKDRVAIVVYAGASGLVLPSTPADQLETIYSALESLHAGGSTNGGSGIQLAYKIAQKEFIPGGTNRVILATDGDFNIGMTNRAALIPLIGEKAEKGVFLSVLGFGMGNYKDSILEKLADKGNGNYAYIDTLKEAQKVLVHEMGGTLVTIAKDVKLQVEFNPKHVNAFRLLGYENRKLEHQDFNDDKKDAGEIGAGHTVTAFYEVVPAGIEAQGAGTIDPLKYQRAKEKSIEIAGSDELLTVKIRYKEPEEGVSQKFEIPLRMDFKRNQEASSDFNFAAAVASFGMVLRDSEHRGNATFDSVQDLAEKGKGEDPSGRRQELIELIRKARKLFQDDV